MNINLRKAEYSDIEDVYLLSNSIDVRSNSINQNSISWLEHEIWFKKKLANENYYFYIISDEKNSFIGQLRYEINNTDAVVSISICDAFRGKGISTKALFEGTKIVFKEREYVSKIIAYINTENKASQKSFLKAGYKFAWEELFSNKRFFAFIIEREPEDNGN